MSKEEVVTLKNHTLLDEETLAWLNQFAGYPLSDRQRLALAYLRVNVRMTNADYRRLHHRTVETVEATRELRGLVETGPGGAESRWDSTGDARHPPLGTLHPERGSPTPSATASGDER